MSNKIFIKDLRALYHAGNLVPFIGAGLSVPFQVPDWDKLIKDMAIDMGIKDFSKTSLLPLLELNLETYDYWEAVRLIKRYLKRSEQDIQGYIVNKVNESINLDIVEEKHNYSDLGNLDFNNYITTNYDHILNNFIKSNFVPVNLKDINENTQGILTEKGKTRIFHLHGNISDASSIVISEEKYKELYDNDKYKALFSLFTGVKTFLFLGFSFNDVFIQKIIKQHNEFFKTKHYIILNNPNDEQISYLKENYNIEIISYNSEISSHSVEIRKILNEISSEIAEEDISTGEITEQFIDELIEDLPDKQKKIELEKNLFCQKLRLENIDDKKIDYSKQCFFTAEQYIRWLKKSGIQSNEKVIRHMLGLCYLEYESILIDVYNVHKDSDAFLHSVHKALSKLQYPRLEKILSSNTMPLDINKQGFIHLIADDKDADNDVWWGGNRVE